MQAMLLLGDFSYNALRDKGVEESWEILKGILLRSQKLSIPACKKLGKESKRQEWLNNSLLSKLKHTHTHTHVQTMKTRTDILGRLQGYSSGVWGLKKTRHNYS